jgi:hypothetical protein
MNESCHKPDEPFTYECCSDKIDGITSEYLIDLWNKGIKEEDKLHIPCMNCGKVYHLFKLGMKFTNEILHKEALEQYRNDAMQYELHKDDSAELSIDDVDKLVCHVCKSPMFHDESYETKLQFLGFINPIIKNISGLLPVKEISELRENIIKASLSRGPGCRSCNAMMQSNAKNAKYN